MLSIRKHCILRVLRQHCRLRSWDKNIVFCVCSPWVLATSTALQSLHFLPLPRDNILDRPFPTPANSQTFCFRKTTKITIVTCSYLSIVSIFDLATIFLQHLIVEDSNSCWSRCQHLNQAKFGEGSVVQLVAVAHKVGEAFEACLGLRGVVWVAHPPPRQATPITSSFLRETLCCKTFLHLGTCLCVSFKNGTWKGPDKKMFSKCFTLMFWEDISQIELLKRPRQICLEKQEIQGT